MRFNFVASAATIVAFLSIVANAQEQCNPCPGGITADPDTETIPGKTCGTVQEDAADFSATSNTCRMITLDAKEKCCPDIAEPDFTSCSVCSEGLTVSEDTEIPNTGGRTCGAMMISAKDAAEGGNVCTQMKQSEGTCCSENPPADGQPTTCSVCSNGIPEENYDLQTTASGKTCQDLLVDAPKYEEDSRVCNIMKTSEADCCPFVETTIVEPTTTIEVEPTTTIEEIVTSSPTAPTPTASPTKQPTPVPTSRDEIFGNILGTPTNGSDENGTSQNDVDSPTDPPIEDADPPTYGPTTYDPTYSPTYYDLAGRGRQPPSSGAGSQFSLPGESAGVSFATNIQLGFVVTLCLSLYGIISA